MDACEANTRQSIHVTTIIMVTDTFARVLNEHKAATTMSTTSTNTL